MFHGYLPLVLTFLLVIIFIFLCRYTWARAILSQQLLVIKRNSRIFRQEKQPETGLNI